MTAVVLPSVQQVVGNTASFLGNPATVANKDVRSICAALNFVPVSNADGTMCFGRVYAPCCGVVVDVSNLSGDALIQKLQAAHRMECPWRGGHDLFVKSSAMHQLAFRLPKTAQSAGRITPLELWKRFTQISHFVQERTDDVNGMALPSRDTARKLLGALLAFQREKKIAEAVAEAGPPIHMPVAEATKLIAVSLMADGIVPMKHTTHNVGEEEEDTSSIARSWSMHHGNSMIDVDIELRCSGCGAVCKWDTTTGTYETAHGNDCMWQRLVGNSTTATHPVAKTVADISLRRDRCIAQVMMAFQHRATSIADSFLPSAQWNAVDALPFSSEELNNSSSEKPSNNLVQLMENNKKREGVVSGASGAFAAYSGHVSNTALKKGTVTPWTNIYRSLRQEMLGDTVAAAGEEGAAAGTSAEQVASRAAKRKAMDLFDEAKRELCTATSHPKGCDAPKVKRVEAGHESLLMAPTIGASPEVAAATKKLIVAVESHVRDFCEGNTKPTKAAPPTAPAPKPAAPTAPVSNFGKKTGGGDGWGTPAAKPATQPPAKPSQPQQQHHQQHGGKKNFQPQRGGKQGQTPPPQGAQQPQQGGKHNNRGGGGGGQQHQGRGGHQKQQHQGRGQGGNTNQRGRGQGGNFRGRGRR